MNATTTTTVPTTATAGSGRDTAARRTGLVLTVLVGLFLLFDAVTHTLAMPQAVQAFQAMGYPLGVASVVGVIELVFLVLYAVPRTSLFGALLLTAYLGGAVSALVRVDAPLWSGTLFPVYTAVLLWAGLYLRYPAVRRMVPFRTR